MTITYHGGNILRGTAADRTGTTWTNLQVGFLFIETDTLLIYYWNAGWFLISGGGSGGIPAVYDDFPTTYDVTTDDTLTPNSKWRVRYRGGVPTIYNVVGPGDAPTGLGTTQPRYGINLQAASVLVGQSIGSFTARLRRTGAPSGNVTATVRRSSDDAIVGAFVEAFPATGLSTVFADVVFTLASPYTLASGDRILVEYNGPANTVQIDLWTTDHFDGANTRRTRYAGGVYSEGNTADIVGKLALSDPGKVGVRVPGSPAGGFSRVFYEYPYLNTYTGTGTSASLVTTETSYYADFQAELSMRLVDQRKSTPNAWESPWILFRFNENEGVYFHHYYLILKTDGTLELGRKDNSTGREEQTFLSTSATYTYALNTWIKVKVQAVSNHIQVWINDVLKIDLVDDGSIGTHVDAILGTIPVEPPSTFMYQGLVGMYNEDAEVEFGPMTIGGATGGGGATVDAVTTYSNKGATGVPIILTKTGSDLPFKSIGQASDKIQIIDNPLTNAVAIDVVESQLDKDSMRGGTIFRDVATQDVVNTVAETAIFSAVIPGNKLSINKMARLTLTGDYQCNSGTPRTITLKIKFGATTLYQDVTPAFATGSARRAVRLVAELTNLGATNIQELGGVFMVSDAGGTTSGLGDINDENIGSFSNLTGFSNIDSTINQTFEVTVTHSAAEANVSLRKWCALLEVV